MEKEPRCQSCGLPFNKAHAHFIVAQPDGTQSPYCTNCYQNGKFIEPDITMEGMMEKLLPVLERTMGAAAAKKELDAVLPTLERWKSADPAK